MSVVQPIRRAADPLLKRCAARYLAGAGFPGTTFSDAAAVDARGSQRFLTRMLSTEINNDLDSYTKPSADQCSPEPISILKQNPSPRLVLQRTDESTSVGADVSLPPYQHPTNGTQKVSGRLLNVPKFSFKSDLIWFLRGCNLRPEDLVFIYDFKFRSKHAQVSFSSVESFRLAQRSLAMKGRLGGRYLKLTQQEEAPMDDANAVLHHFRGRSLVMKVPPSVGTEEVERFFSGYTLDHNYPIKFMRPMAQGGRRPPAVPAKLESESRVLIRFRTESEALRALREKQGCFCVEKAMDLRFLE